MSWLNLINSFEDKEANPPYPAGLGEIIILAGQSNCGRARVFEMNAVQQTKWSGLVPNVKIWNNINLALENINVGSNTMLGNPVNPDEFGPEASLMRLLSADGKKRYIIKVAYGDTDLATYWNSRATPEADGWYRIKKAIELSLPLIVSDWGNTTIALRALIWMQGENDATRSDWAASYKINLQNFISDTIAYWKSQLTVNGVADLYASKIIIPRINAPVEPYRDVVRQAQSEYCNETGAIMINTDSYTLRDTVHYDASSQIVFGNQILKAL